MQQGWYYVQNHKQQGPIDLVDLQRMLKSRFIPFDTLVWHQSLSAWVAAESLEAFKPQPKVVEVEPEVIDTPPPPPAGGGYTAPPKKRRPLSSTIVIGHPWRRYFARSIDGILMVFILPMIPPNPSILMNYKLSIPTLLIAVLAHAVLQSTWGSTPGKEIMRYSVRNPNGSKLSFQQALRREFRILLHGLGFGIPFLSFFTQLAAYNSLQATGTTSWDKDGGFVVKHR